MAATKREIKMFLDETGYTKEDMQNFWDELIELKHPLICAFEKCGKTWDLLEMRLIRELPDAKVKLAEAREKEKREREDREERARREREAKEYYWNHFNEIMLKKIDNGEELAEHELKTLVYDFEHDEIEHGSGRWTTHVETIVELCGRFFSIQWERGLTECQENEFYNQPEEVYLYEYEKVITVKEWLPKDKVK